MSWKHNRDSWISRRTLRSYARRISRRFAQDETIRRRLLEGEVVVFERHLLGRDINVELLILDADSGEACCAVSCREPFLSDMFPVSVAFQLGCPSGKPA